MKRITIIAILIAAVLSASAQGEWKWAHCWSSTPPPNNYDVNTVKNIDFDDEGNVYVLGTFGGNLTFDGNTFLFLNNPTVYYNSSWSAFIMKYDTMGNMLWHKEVKTSRDSRCIPHWLEVRDNKVYVMGNAGLTDVDAYSDDQAWHYWLDTLITGSQVRLWPNPATERITIESEEDFPIISVSVADMKGAILTLLPVNDVRCTLNVLIVSLFVKRRKIHHISALIEWPFG